MKTVEAQNTGVDIYNILNRYCKMEISSHGGLALNDLRSISMQTLSGVESAATAAGGVPALTLLAA